MVSTNHLRLFTVVSSSGLKEAPPPSVSSPLPCSALLWSLRDKVPCPPQDEEVLEAQVEEEEQEVDVTTVKTSTSREEVRCVKPAGHSTGALASWMFAALCAGHYNPRSLQPASRSCSSRVGGGQVMCCSPDPEEGPGPY